MINEQVLSEKLKYLIEMNLKSTYFKLINLYVEFEYLDKSETKIENYDVSIKFDYEGALEPDMYEFAHGIRMMSEKLRDVLNEYVVTRDGKIVNKDKINCYASEGSVWQITYETDTTHIFDMSYRFHYQD